GRVDGEPAAAGAGELLVVAARQISKPPRTATTSANAPRPASSHRRFGRAGADGPAGGGPAGGPAGGGLGGGGPLGGRSRTGPGDAEGEVAAGSWLGAGACVALGAGAAASA